MDFVIYPLVLMTFFPLLGVLVLLFLKPEQKNVARWVALITSLITFGVSLAVLFQFDPTRGGIQLEAQQSWIKVAGWNIDFYMGVDGLSILLVLLTTLLTPIAILSTWSAVEERVKEFMVFFM
ncbi:MAG: Fe-S-binding domain-containing protein, partial [Anaerolineales bacterium]|nr:Fe-S-binding domain-containing protein [Anaerolineales bacterium]